ncbi:uncharacterized protein LOC125029496 [Penaeus chinensis]|uniref:uncharacterized protein LOC125029496 n=1 Tax=Penaeus chinensis TaxID=139456 RepID=UPI001FB6308A|nr:uncharacterized protein LOC125029496 [Penaeus chinensis]
MPVEPLENDSFLLVSDVFELVIEEEEDGWCHVVPSASDASENSPSEALPLASASSSTPSSPPPPPSTHLSPLPRKHEDLFFLDGHYEDAVPNDNEGEEAGAADIRAVEGVDIQEVGVEEEQDISSEAEEDYEEFWEADELVDAYCLTYGHDDVVDKSAEDFGAKRKISLKGSRQRKKEAARRPAGKDLYMNQDQLNWREFKKHMTKKTFQKKHLDWTTYKRTLNKAALRPALCDKQKNTILYL